MPTPNNKIDFAIITALPEELDAVLSKLGTCKTIADESESLLFHQGNIGNAKVIVTRMEKAGIPKAAIAANTVLERYQPTYLLMVGIAAGFKGKVELGDVVVAESCYYDGPGKDTAEGILPAPQQLRTSSFLCGRSLDYQNMDWKAQIHVHSPKGEFQPRVHHGVIASSERVIGKKQRMTELLDQHRELRAVAMEGYGVAEAAHGKLAHFLEIRGISDFGDGEKNDEWHDYAAEVAAAYAVGLLRYIEATYLSQPESNLTGLQDLSGLTPAPNLTGLQDLSGLKPAPNLTGLRDLSGLKPAPNLTGLQDLSGLKPPESLDLSRLPRPTMPLIGRQTELQQVQQAFLNPKTYLTILVAAGGIGKSALSDAWLKQIQPHYHGVQRVFAWSFYSQGSHNTQTSSVPFFQVALPFFGWTGEIPKDDVAKGRALAKCLQAQAFILILDGLEPLQHPTQILDGELKDTALQAFLEEVRLYGLAAAPSLILVSSRQPLVELQAWEAERYVTIDLQTLPVADGAQVLAALGVQGTATELTQASDEMGGHALALVLLGKLLKEKFAGRIERRDQLPKLWEERKQGGHALRVLQFYAERYWQPETPELAFVQLLGLFDRPMTLREKEVLVTQADCAEPLRALDDVGWQDLETHLEAAGLLLHTEEAERYHWDCHPLIRDYFGQRFQDSQPELFRQAHRVLFDYYQTVPTQPQPDTLEELEPLYRAVVHGCLAGEYQKALDEVYWDRIRRSKEGYSIHKLGAYSQDLTALAAFFPHGWSQPVQHGLTEADQAWLLAVASFCLMSLGRLGEAVAPREADLKLWVKQQAWVNASRDAQNLIDLYLPLGQLAKAATVARQAIQYAEQSGDLSEQMTAHAYLATTLHQQGPLDLAQQSFQRAEQLQQEWQPEYPQLYSLPGFQYCALLLDQAQSVAEFEAVLGRAKTSSKWYADDPWLLDISLDHLTLARVFTQLRRDDEAAASFDQAVAGIRKAGKIQYLPMFLIDRANFHLRPSRLNLEAAAHDLQQADSLIRRYGMKLNAVDCQLAWCRYYLARGETETARECWGRAKMGMEVTGYGLRAGEVGELEKATG
jgi:nucleoside phosphorylase/tetratricopeptide (TPR) repeat protein